MNTLKTITVGELRRDLSLYSDDTPLFFGTGNLSYYRPKNRGGDTPLLQIEFSELYEITHDPASES